MTGPRTRRRLGSTLESTRTSPETVCVRMRRAIIRGDYPPGQRLTEDALADEFGVSRIPIREALRVLESEGFVRVQPYYGTFVAEFTPEQASDLLAVRRALEPLAASLAAERATPGQLGQLTALIEEGWAAANEERYEDVSAVNGAFHELLAEASGSPTVLTLISQLRDKIDWVYSVEVPRRARDSWAEHEEIVAAIESRDAPRAAAAAQDHIDHALAAYHLRVETSVTGGAPATPTAAPATPTAAPATPTAARATPTAASAPILPD